MKKIIKKNLYKFLSVAALSCTVPSLLFAQSNSTGGHPLDSTISGLAFLAIILLMCIAFLGLAIAFLSWEMFKSSERKKTNPSQKAIINAVIFIALGIGTMSYIPELNAQDVPKEAIPTVKTTQENMYDFLVHLNIGLGLVVMLMGGYTLMLLDTFFKKSSGSGFLPSIDGEYFSNLWDKLVGNTPENKHLDQPIEGHSYDGIIELDNSPPPIFNILFYSTIIFGVVYMIRFHMMDGSLMIEEYNQEMVAAEIAKEEYLKNAANSIDENNVEIFNDDASLSSGKEVFTTLCAACHGNNGEGQVGPNMTDPYWIHGGGIKDIFKTIKYGVPAKGMRSWESDLSPKQMADVASYILTLQGTNPPNPKEPEGELYHAPTTDSTVVDSTQIELNRQTETMEAGQIDTLQ